MASTAGISSATRTGTPSARRMSGLWLAGALAGAAYGVFLIATALRLPSGAELTGQFTLQPAVKASMAVLLAAAAATCAACVALLVWFWPRLIADGMAAPVTVYIAVLGAMVCAALLARLPTPWTALGAVCFAVSDAMIGIGRFVLQSEALLFITAGFFFGRWSDPSATSAG